MNHIVPHNEGPQQVTVRDDVALSILKIIQEKYLSKYCEHRSYNAIQCRPV
ncbi:hypothetical protein MUP51_00035 [Candidatus Bathyarchaeota archaeon]|nr:hypothetical protein [Candidatus Bathyarchaeota archaeon]